MTQSGSKASTIYMSADFQLRPVKSVSTELADKFLMLDNRRGRFCYESYWFDLTRKHHSGSQIHLDSLVFLGEFDPC